MICYVDRQSPSINRYTTAIVVGKSPQIMTKRELIVRQVRWSLKKKKPTPIVWRRSAEGCKRIFICASKVVRINIFFFFTYCFRPLVVRGPTIVRTSGGQRSNRLPSKTPSAQPFLEREKKILTIACTSPTPTRRNRGASSTFVIWPIPHSVTTLYL